MSSPIQENVLRPLPHAVGPEMSVLSSILQEPSIFLRRAESENIVADDFYQPGHRTLFSFLRKMHDEGQEIELVTLTQKLLDNGLLDRVGGPSELASILTYAVNHNHFSLHVEHVKNKSILREVIKRADEQIKAAYESPDEVKELVEKCAEDAAHIQKKTENRASDFKKYREQVVSPEAMKDAARSYLNGDVLLGGDPFFLDGFDFACRKHESSVWVGTSFHGKSQSLQNQIAFLAARGRKSLLASFEQDPSITMGQILRAMTCYSSIGRSEEYDPAWNYINSVVSIYKCRKRITAAHIIQTFRQAYLIEGTDTFVVDNFLAIQADRGDNSAVADACERFRMFVAEFPVHLHLVLHPRKPSNDAKANPNKPPTQADIRGAAEVGDLAHNVLVVWADMEKRRKIEEMRANRISEFEIGAFHNSTPCGFIALEKQRLTGAMPKRNTWFDKKVNQFTSIPGAARPMFGSTPPWEVAS